MDHNSRTTVGWNSFIVLIVDHSRDLKNPILFVLLKYSLHIYFIRGVLTLGDGHVSWLQCRYLLTNIRKRETFLKYLLAILKRLPSASSILHTMVCAWYLVLLDYAYYLHTTIRRPFTDRTSFPTNSSLNSEAYAVNHNDIMVNHYDVMNKYGKI